MTFCTDATLYLRLYEYMYIGYEDSNVLVDYGLIVYLRDFT